jgi:hypothetical protein
VFQPPYPDYDQVAAKLAALGVPPDFASSEPLRYNHRQLKDGEVYFVSNPADGIREVSCAFRVSGRQPECWDPLTGQMRDLPDFVFTADGRTEIPLRLAGHESCFIVFRQQAASPGGLAGKNFSDFSPVAEITGPWEISFQPGRGAPAKFTLGQLGSWSGQKNSGVKYFSGEAVYRKTLTLAPELVAAGRPLFLDLGRVEVMAEVTLNGHSLGTLWCAPFRVDISPAARAGDNLLAIKVVNLWPNRMIGDEKLRPGKAHRGNVAAWPPWLIEGKPNPTGRITWASNNPFGAGSPLLPSGLLGPVWLQTSSATP